MPVEFEILVFLIVASIAVIAVAGAFSAVYYGIIAPIMGKPY